MFSGIRVVELAQGVGGPFCGRLLAAMGARVTKWEPGAGGDYARRMAPLAPAALVKSPTEGSLTFQFLNQCKESVAVDLADAQGRKALLAALAQADVLITDLSAEAVAPLGLGYEEVHQRFPRLIYTAVTPFGYGSRTPKSGVELLAQAYSGMLYMIGDPKREPIKLGGYQSSYSGGGSAFLGTVVALIARMKTDKGQLVDAAMTDVLGAMDWKSTVTVLLNGTIPRRSGTTSRWRLVRAADGWLGLVYQPVHWPTVCKLVGDPRLEHDDFNTQKLRNQNVARWLPIIEEWMATRSCREVYHQAQALGVPIGYVCTLEEILTNPQYKARGFFKEVTYPALGGATIPVPSTPYSGEGLEWRIRPAPALGADTAAVLAELRMQTQG